MLESVMLTLAEASDSHMRKPIPSFRPRGYYHYRHFDRAKASGEIPKSYALSRGDLGRGDIFYTIHRITEINSPKIFDKIRQSAR